MYVYVLFASTTVCRCIHCRQQLCTKIHLATIENTIGIFCVHVALCISGCYSKNIHALLLNVVKDLFEVNDLYYWFGYFYHLG